MPTSPRSTHHDLVVIGSGSGNSLVTPELEGLDIAVVERGTFGGTCLNVGCIPTKMYVYPADLAASARDAARFGVDAHVDGVRWGDIRDRIFGRIDPIAEGGRRWRLEGPGTTAYLGSARFTGARTMTIVLGPDDPRREQGVSRVEVTADQVVVASGARPVVPAVVTDSGVPFHTSDTVMRLPDLPRRVVVLGGGFIAVEMAHIFEGLGSEVHLVHRGPRLLRQVDDEISAAFTRQATSQWRCHLERTVTKVVTTGDDTPAGPEVEVTLDDGTTLTADVLLVATGRAPSSPDLDCAAAGVELHPDGRVRVDPHGRTTADGVWSLGDVSSPYQLKHVANHEARVVAHNLAVTLGRAGSGAELRSFNHQAVPSAVFTHPQLASVGLTEAAARAAGHDVTAYTQAYGDTAAGWAMEDGVGRCKVIAERGTGRLLGAHLMGSHAATLIQPLIQAMATGLDVTTMAREQYWIHPALTEVVENALLGLDLRPSAG